MPSPLETPMTGRPTSERPLLIDLFCCAGGAAMGYHRAGFDVLGVDIQPQPNYPFRFEQADALDWLARGSKVAAAYHASPPCQAELKGLAAVNRKLGRAYTHQSLLVETREALRALGGMYVIEQPEQGAKLVGPVRYCGTSFGLPLRRHRQFEANVALVAPPCAHERFTERKYWTSWRPNKEHRLATTVQVYGNAGGREHWPSALGIDWMTPAEMIEAIPPVYTEHIGLQLLVHLAMQRAA